MTADPPDLTAFARYLAAEGVRSEHSRRAYVGVVRRQLASGCDPLEWVTEQLVSAPAGTAAQIRAAMRHWRAFRQEHPLTIPRGARKRRVHRSPMSAQELASFYRKAKHAPGLLPSVRIVLALLPRTGLRISEACALRVRDLRRGEGTWGLYVDRGKGEHQRFVPLTDEALRVLQAWVREHRAGAPAGAWMFPGARADVLPADTVRDHLRDIRGEHDWSPHKLRHTFATRYYHATGDLLGLSEILGHKSIETTRIYVQASASHKRRGMEAAELREPSPPRGGGRKGRGGTRRRR